MRHTAVDFVRVTDEVSPATISIQWYVVEFATGVAVQRGEVTQSSTTVNVTITAVAALVQAFVTWSKTPVSTDNAWGSDDFVVGELTTTTNLQLRSSSANASHTIAWQVIGLTNSTTVTIDRAVTGTTSASLLNAWTTGLTHSNSAGSNRLMVFAVGYEHTSDTPNPSTATIAAEPRGYAVAAVISGNSGTYSWNNSWTLGSDQTHGATTDMSTADMAETSSTTDTASAPHSGPNRQALVVAYLNPLFEDDRDEIVWQAVELKDDSPVQSGSASFTKATAALSATAITLARASTVDTADVGWFVVSFRRRWVPITQ